jgi:hypothetical protein
MQHKRAVETVETGRDRQALARDAGMRQVSMVSILAGTLAAYGAVAVLLAIAGGIAAAVNSGTDFSNLAWTQLKAGTGIIVALVLLVSYFFGGYVSGRMARRSGVINGVGVFVLGVIVALVVGVWVKQAGGGSSITTALRNVGAPTTWHEWRDVGTIAGIASLAAMLIGSILGGAAGDRWHSKLLARALDPAVGPEAVLARQAAVQAADADAAHMAAEERVARSRGRTLGPTAGAAATAAPVVAHRSNRRQERLANERVGLAAPATMGTAAPAKMDRAEETRREQAAEADAATAAADERERERAAAAERDRAAAEADAAAEEQPQGRHGRSMVDRLLHR